MSFGDAKIRRAAGQEIRLARERSGVTQGQLAHRLRVVVAHIQAIESGAEEAEVGELVQIAHAIGVEPAKLLKKILRRAARS